MTDFIQPKYIHANAPTTGILLCNLGSPEAPTAKAVRRYLAEFLSDPRIVEMPRWLWKLVLHGIILRTRPRRVAKNYQKIWTPTGSPLLNISRRQLALLQQQLAPTETSTLKFALGMSYGKPALSDALESLRAANAQRIIVLPLYPQYASATTGATWDGITQVLKSWRWIPELHFISHYHDHPLYIQALVDAIKDYWAQHGRPDKLLFSFHGIPKETMLAGDPYFCESQKTARLVAEQLAQQLEQQVAWQLDWSVTFQSRFGPKEWLQPYTDHTLQALGKAGCKRVDVICPGFAADCLETLEEINEENRGYFLQAGGEAFHYIPALNDNPSHIKALAAVLSPYLNASPSLQQAQITAEASAQRAQALAAGQGESTCY
ncbi:ferrochelatase [Candidatus Venteria ishoeyi]|uniref:Ferrochelatase n=1 Tax=Candidatus Venteria ishoeyi TaxID=1899563 RepID=A0A1H6F392_9GAMM|nr:ferrochelatase [Candidatus Venteria ishoeyi]SEH04627.1 Ferrochelatase [Candidatus Venteria ishoeyi]